MKILLFVNRFPVVSETFVISQVEGLLEQGAEVEIAALMDCSATCVNQLSRNVPIHSVFREQDVSRVKTCIGLALGLLDVVIRPRKWVLLVHLFALLSAGNGSAAADLLLYSRFLKLAEYDLILCHFGPQGVLANCLRSCGAMRGNIATIFHGYELSNRRILRRYRRPYRCLFRDTELLLPISYFWHKKLLELGAPEAKLMVFRMGIAIPEHVAEPKGLHHPLRLLTVGRLVEKKGLEYSIRGVIESTLPVEYRIVGSGPLAQSLQRQALDAGDCQRVSFLGALANKEVLDLMVWSDVFVLTSVTAVAGDMEGIPVVLMEAMSRNNVVISTHHSGIGELIESGVSGFLVDERDSSTIAKVLNSLVLGDLDLEAIRGAAKVTVVDRFDDRRITAELLLELAQLGRM